MAGGDHDDRGAEEGHVLVGMTMKMMEVQSKETLVPVVLFCYTICLFSTNACLIHPKILEWFGGLIRESIQPMHISKLVSNIPWLKLLVGCKKPKSNLGS